MCCSQFRSMFSRRTNGKGSKSKENLFDYLLLVAMPNKFGWPYNYIFDDPSIKETTA